MTNSVTVNGITYNDGAWNAVSNPYGLANGGNVPNWVPMIGNVMVELNAVKAPGMSISGGVLIGTGAKSLLLNASATIPAGIYILMRQSELAAPTNYMFIVVAAGVVNGTEVEGTVYAGGTSGAGTYTDFVLTPVNARRAPSRNVSGNDTQLTTDFGGVVRYTGAGGHTETMLSASTAGVGFTTTFINVGSGASGAWTVNGASITAGNASTFRSNGTTWELVSSTGGGLSAAQTWGAICAS